MAAAPEETSAPARPDRSIVLAVAPVFVLFGLAVRVWMLTTGVGGLDSDEAVVGLMARDILDGDLPLFYWGQSHGGPHEPLLTAAFFWAFGASTVVLKIVAILLSAVACVLVWRVGRRTVGEPAATVAGLLFWIWPAAFVWWSVKSRGFYHAALVLGLCALLLALRLARRESVRDMALLGAVVATGLWCSPQTVLLVGPALVWLVVRTPSIVWLAPVSVAGGIAAAFPFWAHNLDNGWVTFRTAQSTLTGYGERLRGIFETGLPGTLGLKMPEGSRWMAGGFGRAWYFVLLALFVAAVVREIFFRRSPDDLRAGRILLLVTAAVYPFALALSPFSWFVAHPRYLYYLGAICALLVARALGALRGPALVAGLLAALTLTTAALATVNRERIFYPASEGVVIPEDLDPLVDYLTGRDTDHVYAEYWLAYYLSFETGERIVATPYRGAIRDVDADAAVRSAPEAAYVFLTGTPSEPVFRDEIAAMDVPHERVEVDGFVVYELDQNVPPESFPGMQAAQP